MRVVRSVTSLVSPAVSETIQHLDLAAEDVAAVRLAQRYATAIDSADDDGLVEVLEKLGPKLAAVLDALGATPRARAAIAKPTVQGGPSRLSALRVARQA